MTAVPISKPPAPDLSLWANHTGPPLVDFRTAGNAAARRWLSLFFVVAGMRFDRAVARDHPPRKHAVGPARMLARLATAHIDVHALDI